MSKSQKMVNVTNPKELTNITTNNPKVSSNIKQNGSTSDEFKNEKNSSPIFCAEMVKGYALKIMIDALYTADIQRGFFVADENGIMLRQSDDPNTILFDIFLPRESFVIYRLFCNKFSFSVNLKHFHTMLKNVKTKDSVTLIAQDENLKIIIVPVGTREIKRNRSETNTIAYRLEDNYVPIEMLEHDYCYPMVILSSDFQKLKRLMSLNKTIKIKQQGSEYICFSCDSNYKSELNFGSIEEGDKLFESTYYSSILNKLNKLTGLCSSFQFYAPSISWHPLRIGIDITKNNFSMGRMDILIKDIDQIERDRRQELNGNEDNSSTTNNSITVIIDEKPQKEIVKITKKSQSKK